jgi:hypothetical protein
MDIRILGNIQKHTVQCKFFQWFGNSMRPKNYHLLYMLIDFRNIRELAKMIDFAARIFIDLKFFSSFCVNFSLIVYRYIEEFD